MNGVFRALVGSWRLTFFSPRPERILNFALGKNLPFWALSYENGGNARQIRRSGIDTAKIESNLSITPPWPGKIFP